MSRTVGLLIALAALAACAKPATVYEPVPVTEEFLVYVPVPEKLTEPLPIATGPLKECPDVARKRRAALEQCNADRAEVRSLQGTETARDATPRDRQ